MLNIVPVADSDTPERVENGKVELWGHVYGLTGALAQETRELAHLFQNHLLHACTHTCQSFKGGFFLFF